MSLRPFLPTLAFFSALALTSTAYYLSHHTDSSGSAQADADGCPADPLVEVLFVRSEATDLVVRETIAGRTTVPEAAALVRWLDARPPRRLSVPTDQLAELAGLPDCGDCTEPEQLGLRVVAMVELMARSGAVLPPGCKERVRCEFLTARAEGAFTRLPRVSEEQCGLLLERARAEAQRIWAGRLKDRQLQAVE